MNAFKIFLVTICCAATAFVSAANITSTTTGGNWNSTGTWVGGVIPGTNDDVIIDGNVAVTASTGCLSLIVNSSKTLTVNSGITLTVTRTSINNWSNTFVVRNDGTIVLQTGGNNRLAITLPQSQNWTIFINNGTFTGNTGKLSVTTSADNTLMSNSGTFNAPDTAEFKASGNAPSLSSTLAFKNVVLDNMRMNFGSGKTITGTLRLNNGAYMSSHPTYGSNATLEVNGSYSLNSNYYLWPNSTGTDVAPNIKFISGTTTLDQMNLYVVKTLSVASGAIVNAQNACFTLAPTFSAFTVAGTFNIGSIIVGNGATWNINADYTINKLKIESTGVVNAGSYNLNINATSSNGCGISGMVEVVSGGVFNPGTGTVILTPTNWYSVNGNITFNNLVVNNGGSGTVVIPTANTVTVTGNVTVNTGAAVNQANNINFGNGATVTNNGTVSGSTNNFPPTVPSTPSSTTYLTGTVSGSKTGAAAIQSPNSVTLGGNLNINAGSSKTLTIAPASELIMGNYTVTADTIFIYGKLSLTNAGGLTSAFTRASGTPVIIIGSGSTITYNGATTQTVTARTDYVNLQLSGSGTKTFAAGNYSIAGDFGVTGGTADITTNAPVFNFNGTGAQSIKGLPFSTVTFSGSGNKTLTDTAKVTSVVNITGSANLVSNGLLTLSSTASGTASIGALIGNATITGAVNYERYIPAGRLWRFIGWPISGNTIANSWQNQIYITGAGTGGSLGTTNSNGFDYTTSGEAGVYYYNETSTASMNSKWTTVPNTSTVIDPTRGYRVFVRGDRAQGISLLNGSSYTPLPVTLKGTGNPNKGDIAVSLTCSNGCGTGDGWHLLSNPYPSAIDWNSSTWVAARNANVLTTLYIYNPAQNRYGSWSPTGGSVNGGSSQIASGQSFYIKTNGATTLTFKETYKVQNGTVGLFGKNSALVNNLKMQLGDNNKVFDETVVYMYPGATNGMDQDLDATKPDVVNASISTYTSLDNSKLVFNAIPELNNGDVDTIMMNIPLANATYTYNITFAGIESFANPSTQFILVDSYTGSSALMSPTSPVYTFATTVNTAGSYATDRFKLIITTATGSLPVKLTYFNGKKSGAVSVLKWATASEQNNDRFDIERSADGISYTTIGSVAGSNNSVKLIEYSFTDENPIKGVNYYRLKQVDRDEKATVSNVISINFVEKTKTAVTASPIPADDYITVQFNNASAVGATIRIMDMVGKIMYTQSILADEAYYTYPIQVANFKSGVYFMEIKHTDGTAESIKFLKN